MDLIMCMHRKNKDGRNYIRAINRCNRDKVLVYAEINSISDVKCINI